MITEDGDQEQTFWKDVRLLYCTQEAILSEPENASQGTFESVCLLLQAGHRQGSDTPEQTLKRLFRKHLTGHKKDIAADPPWLSCGNTVVTMESRSKPALRKLAPRSKSRTPRHENFPVVIIRYCGQECLIDGGSRIYAWHRAGDTGNHPAYILTVGV